MCVSVMIIDEKESMCQIVGSRHVGTIHQRISNDIIVDDDMMVWEHLINSHT